MTASPTRPAVVFDRPPSSRRAVLRMGAGALVLIAMGLLLGIAVDAVSPLPIEERALAAVADDRSPAVTTFFLVVTTMGDLWAVVLAAALVTPVLRRLTGGWQAAVLLWGALLGSLLVTTVVKVVIGRARPLDALVEADSGAFPSGHTSRAAAVLGLCIWAVLALAPRRGIRAAGATLLGAGIALMAFSRLYLGVHWPTDVAYGLIIGLAWLVIMLKAVSPRVVSEGDVDPDSPMIRGPT